MAVASETCESTVRAPVEVRRVAPCSAVQRDVVGARRGITRANAQAWRLCDDSNESIHSGAAAGGRVCVRRGNRVSCALDRAAVTGRDVELQQPGLLEPGRLGHPAGADRDLRDGRGRWNPGLRADGESSGAGTRAVDDDQRQLQQPAHKFRLDRRSMSGAHDRDLQGHQAQGDNRGVHGGRNQRSGHRNCGAHKRHLEVSGRPSGAARKRHGVAAIAVLVISAFAAAPALAYDWIQFNGDSTHSGNNTAETILGAGNMAQLAQRYQVTMSGTRDVAAP